MLFRDPDHTTFLPRHHSVDRRRRLRVTNLFISQGDLENAFYMPRGFPRLSDFFVTPPIEARVLGICEPSRKTDRSQLFLSHLACLYWLLVGHCHSISADKCKITLGSLAGLQEIAAFTRQASCASSCFMRFSARRVRGQLCLHRARCKPGSVSN